VPCCGFVWHVVREALLGEGLPAAQLGDEIRELLKILEFQVLVNNSRIVEKRGRDLLWDQS